VRLRGAISQKAAIFTFQFVLGNNTEEEYFSDAVANIFAPDKNFSDCIYGNNNKYK
jgi:hypothetical protein